MNLEKLVIKIIPMNLEKMKQMVAPSIKMKIKAILRKVQMKQIKLNNLNK